MLQELQDELKLIEAKITELKGYLKVDEKAGRMVILEKQIGEPNFWNNQETAQKVIGELKDVRSVVEPFAQLESSFKDLKDIVGIAEPEDSASLAHFKNDLAALKRKIDDMEFKTLLGDEADKNNAIMSINAGAGGTEACDWAGMLLRMYTMWAESKGYTIDGVDQLGGEEAGIKNVTVIIKGPYAYGYLKCESGVHRLVRISPFDSNKRRHTSFASVDVIPEVSDDIQIAIKEDELKVDTYRSGGKGGQHVNKTDSAVRLTHIPSGIIVQCQSERSQFKNKQTAMKLLKAKLYEVERQKKLRQVENAYDAKKEIAWGSQIRSYVLHPYMMVKDHRTDCETSSAQDVLDGKLDKFIEAYLKQAKGK